MNLSYEYDIQEFSNLGLGCFASFFFDLLFLLGHRFSVLHNQQAVAQEFGIDVVHVSSSPSKQSFVLPYKLD
ncbi:hypothetical protein Fmac_004209 [Flemingia macrophylla]|uniref:Uncharacterized protein n=1 Tax=Flemingia macrophylla TaxID=520843 RepID=A0ABD1N4C1_9FABA